MEGRADDERQKEDKERMMADDSPGCPWRRAVIEGNMSFPSHYSPISHSAHTQPSSHMHTDTHTHSHTHRHTHTHTHTHTHRHSHTQHHTHTHTHTALVISDDPIFQA